jgi:glycogen(starch) synthase
LKILVLSNMYPPDVIGGYELGCKQAVEGLRRRGHEVRVLTSAPRTPIADVNEPEVHRRLILNDLWYNATRQRSLPAVNSVWEVDSNWFSAHNTHALLHEIEAFRPDVVYVWMLLGVGGLGLMACLQYRSIPWLWHLMDEVPVKLCESNWKVVPGLASAYGRFIRGHYIACSSAMLARIREKGITLSGEVEVVPNWVVGEPPMPRELYYRSGRLRIVSAGRVTREKGVDLLINAAGDLRDRGLDNFLIDVYGPVFDPGLATMARTLGLDGHIRFFGSIPQDRLARELAGADLFAFPTESREPFGFAALEAAAQGCVPLISQVCGIAEWLVHGVHCLKTGRTAGQFADVIAAVLQGAVDLGAIGRRAQAAVWRDFHLDTVLPKIEDHLARASNSSRDRGGTSEEAYRMALIAERLSHAIVQEPFFI